jgi:glycosyltransferase involved in cell wall biosynthesis
MFEAPRKLAAPMDAPGFPEPIDVVLLLQDLEFGGTQRYAIHVLKNLDRNLFTPQLWVLRGGMDMAAAARETGARLVWLSQSRNVGPRAIINLAWRLVIHRPTVLYTLTPVPNIWGRVFGRIVRVPVVVSSFRNILAHQHERLLWRLSSRIVCNALAIKEAIVRRFSIDPDRVAVVPNGVDADYFSADALHKTSHPSVIYVGRLVDQKAPLTLVEAFRLTLSRVPEARLTIVGNGPLRPRVEEYLRSHSLESRITLLPGTPEILPLLHRSWVFAMPSAWEGSPNALIEAMAAGLPVVATRVGGIPDLVDHGVTGLMSEEGDSGRFSENLTRVLLDEQLRRSMGQKGRERVLAHHTIKTMVNGTQEVLLEEVIRSRGLNRPNVRGDLA